MDTGGEKIKTGGKDRKGNRRREIKCTTDQQIQTGREHQKSSADTTVAVADLRNSAVTRLLGVCKQGNLITGAM